MPTHEFLFTFAKCSRYLTLSTLISTYALQISKEPCFSLAVIPGYMPRYGQNVNVHFEKIANVNDAVPLTASTTSVTRFGGILQHWKNSLNSLAIFESFWAKMLSYFGKTSIGQIFIIANGQTLKNNLAIWSHWT